MGGGVFLITVREAMALPVRESFLIPTREVMPILVWDVFLIPVREVTTIPVSETALNPRKGGNANLNMGFPPKTERLLPPPK